MALISRITNAEAPNTDDDVTALRQALARIEAERDKATADNAAIPDAIDRALLADDDAGAEKLEKKLAANRRTLRRHELAEPVVRRRLFEAEELLATRSIAKHRQIALANLDGIVAIVDALLKANANARRDHRAASEEIGNARAAAYVPGVDYLSPSLQDFGRWRSAIEEDLGRRERRYPRPLPGVEVEIIQPSTSLQPGDRITVADAEARQMVEVGRAIYAHPEEVTAPVDPRTAVPPEPDANGSVAVVVVRPTVGFRLMPRDEAGALQPGEVARVPLAQGVRMVRSGFAEFLPAEAVQSLDEEANS